MFIPDNYSPPTCFFYDSYFSKESHVSNSKLNAIEKIKLGKPFEKTPESVYEFGAVFDNFLTKDEEPQSSLLKDYHFSQMQKMRDKFYAFYSKSLKKAKGQVEFYNNEFIVFNGSEFVTIKAKCKADFFIQSRNEILEIKTTTCLTPTDFLKKIIEYKYYRAASWYIDVAEAKSYKLIALNYTNKEQDASVFNHEIWEFSIPKCLLKQGKNEINSILKFAFENNLIEFNPYSLNNS